MCQSAGNDHKITISKLSADLLNATADASFTFYDNAPTTTFNEAPSIFKRGNTWYALFGHCCVSACCLREGQELEGDCPPSEVAEGPPHSSSHLEPLSLFY